MAFYARAAVEPEFADMLLELDREATGNLRAAPAYAESAGELSPGQDHDAFARLIIGIIDGLVWSAPIYEMAAPARIETAVDATARLIAPGTGNVGAIAPASTDSAAGSAPDSR